MCVASFTLRGTSNIKQGLRVLSEIFGTTREEVACAWIKLCNEELNDLYCSPDIIYVIKSWTMRRAGHVARIEGKKEGR